MTTMPAPTAPLPIEVELYAAGDWRDVSADVYHRQDITIQHGPSDESPTSQPSGCTLLLGNSDAKVSAKYDPVNPMSPYYGTIGRNTPMRLSIRSHADDFDRTVADGWGTAADGDEWITFGTGTATVTPGAAEHVMTAGDSIVTHTTAAWGDVDVAVTVTCSLTGSPTTQPVDASIVLRGQDASHYYVARLQYEVDGTLDMIVFDSTGRVIVDLTELDIDQTVGSVRMRVQIERTVIRAKAWDPAGSEPVGWAVAETYNRGTTALTPLQLPLPGWVGMRSDSFTGNTDGTVTMSYSDLVVRAPRYAGLAMLAPTADVTLTDKTVTVTGGGPLRALSRGQQPVASPLTHDIPTALAGSLVAYWPCEDPVPASGGTGAGGFASALPGGQPLGIVSGQPEFASDSAFAGSGPLPVVNSSSWWGRTLSTANDGTFQVRWLMHWPEAATLLDETVVLRVHCTGAALRWDVVYLAGGSLDVRVFDRNSGLAGSMGAIAFDVDGKIMRMALWAKPSGSNLSCQLSTLEQGPVVVGSGLDENFTITGESFGTAYAVAFGPPGNDLKSATIGQVTVEQIHSDTSTDLFDFDSQVNGFDGEAADSRIERVLSYSGYDTGIEFEWSTLPLLCGQQKIDSAFSIAQLAATSDGGLLYDSKGDGRTVMYVSGSAHAWTPDGHRTVAALDVAQHHLSTTPQPTYDDQIVHNDIQATNSDGSSVTKTVTTGEMSTAKPPDGVGDYPTPLQVSLQKRQALNDRAGWELSLGTDPAPRIPQIAVNLMREGNADIYWTLLDVRPDSFISLDGWTADQLLLLARGYSETLNSDKHELQFNTAPGGRYAAIKLDDGLSRWAAGDSALDADADSTATTLSVASNDGTLWTTDAADLPLDIMVGGERITVTDITGSSSPQTFTVTRSVNGVVKDQSAGTAVQIATPAYLALGRN